MAASLEGLCPPGPPSFRGTDPGGPLRAPHFTDDKLTPTDSPNVTQQVRRERRTKNQVWGGIFQITTTSLFVEGRWAWKHGFGDSGDMVLPSPSVCLPAYSTGLQGVTTSQALLPPLLSALLHRDRAAGDTEEFSVWPWGWLYPWASVFPHPALVPMWAPQTLGEGA